MHDPFCVLVVTEMCTLALLQHNNHSPSKSWRARMDKGSTEHSCLNTLTVTLNEVSFKED